MHGLQIIRRYRNCSGRSAPWLIDNWTTSSLSIRSEHQCIKQINTDRTILQVRHFLYSLNFKVFLLWTWKYHLLQKKKKLEQYTKTTPNNNRLGGDCQTQVIQVCSINNLVIGKATLLVKILLLIKQSQNINIRLSKTSSHIL